MDREKRHKLYKHTKRERERERERDLVASVDINSSYPELKGAIPRSEMGGQLFLNILEIHRRQHSALFPCWVVKSVSVSVCVLERGSYNL